MKRLWILGFAALLSGLMVSRGDADVVDHGDFTTPQVNFLDVTEVIPDSSPFFGIPSSSVDGLTFMSTTASGSNLTTVNGQFDFANGALSITLAANQGTLIEGIRVRHYGTISTFGENSLAQVESTGFATVGTQLYTGNFSVSAQGNQVGSSFDQTYEILFPATTQVSFSMQDQMFTIANQTAGFAFANTQGVIIETLALTSIPEPATTVLAVLLLGACCFVRRRTA